MNTERMTQDALLRDMCALGRDVLSNQKMQSLRNFRQHGDVSRYEHCLSVCYWALAMARALRVRVDERSMVRGALLHDFFMYEWSDPNCHRPLHGFTHAREALRNASEVFELNAIERDVIRKHMFPMNIALPRYRETVFVTLADKWSATLEIIRTARERRIVRMCRMVGLL